MDQLGPFAPIILIFVIIALGIVVLKVLSSKMPGKPSMPYVLKPVLTKGERAFFQVLAQAVGNDHLLLSKVRMADFLKVKGAGKESTGFQNSINPRHTDFLLVDRESAFPVLAIELDDKSHRTSKSAMERDQFKNEAYKAAGLPILRVRAARSYEATQIREQIRAKLGG